MPGTFAALFNGFPDLKGKDSAEKKFSGLQDFLYQLTERLGYALTNLDEGNFNVRGLQEITDPIHAEIRDAEAGLTTRIDVTAGKIVLEVTQDLAPEWEPQGYEQGEIVKIPTYDPNDPTKVIGVKYYQCRTAHVAASRPPSANWREIPANTVANSRITQTADAITSEVTRATAAEGTLSGRIDLMPDDIMLRVRAENVDTWQGSHPYYVHDIVKVYGTPGDLSTVSYYECTRQHTSTNTTKPGSGTQWAGSWVLIAEAPNVQSMIDLNLKGVSISYDSGESRANTPYITLNKDGTTIGGGPVYIGTLDAGTIKTGTLNAGQINLEGAFTVKKNINDTEYICGQIGGGVYNGGGELEIFADSVRGGRIRVADGWVEINAGDMQIRMNPATNSMYFRAPDSTGTADYFLRIGPNGVSVEHGSTVQYLIQ